MVSGTARGDDGAVSIQKRVAVGVLEGVGRHLWGFAPNLMPVIVDRLGGAGALAWFVRNMPRYERTLSTFGPIRTHLLATQLSILGACPYCTYGHALAFELHYFRDRGRPFPLTEEQFVALHSADRDHVAETLDGALRSVGLDDEVRVLARARELRDGAAAASAEDARIAHLIQMFGTLNACGVAGDVTQDGAHDPINKDAALRERYAAARLG
jgi:hypothetical protein